MIFKKSGLFSPHNNHYKLFLKIRTNSDSSIEKKMSKLEFFILLLSYFIGHKNNHEKFYLKKI